MPRFAASVLQSTALLTTLLFASSGSAWAASLEDGAERSCVTRPVEPDGRPRVGLALGGGGARGMAHIGVLRKMEELRVPVDCIAGTSMGALIGALYASGMSVDEIETAVLELDWMHLFDDSLARRERSFRRKTDDALVVATPGVGLGSRGIKLTGGLLAGERIMLLFSRMIEPVSTIEDFDRLPIPFRAVAADINTGDPLILSRGDLALAMRASMSLPGIFPPVQIGEHVLVDGGVARNLPVDVVRDMGADIVIAVDVGTPLQTIDAQSSLLAITGQVTGLLTVSNTKEQLATLTERDVLISPPLANRVATAEFTKGREAMAIGNLGAELASAELAGLALSQLDFDRHRSARLGREAEPPLVQFVRLDNDTRYSDALMRSRFQLPLGEPLDVEELEAALYRVHGTGTLAQSTYEVVEEDGRTGVVLHLKEKVQGPNYIEAGLSVSSDYSGRFESSLRLGLLQSPINASGGEVRYLLETGDQSGLLAEYYQPFGKMGEYFFAGRAQYESRQINVFDEEGRATAQYDVAQAGARAAIGREIGNYGAVSIGLRRFDGRAELQIGDPSLGNFDTRTGEVVIEATLDRLDSIFFPRDGSLVRAGYTASREALGADADFDQMDLDAFVAWNLRNHAFLLGGRFHVTSSGVAPIQSVYRVGGFSRLVGFQPNEITGQHYAILLGGYSYRIANLFNQEALVGGMLEYGNVWQERSDIALHDSVLNGSVYIGLDSWIGPILFGIGGREGGERNVFLEVGHRF